MQIENALIWEFSTEQSLKEFEESLKQIVDRKNVVGISFFAKEGEALPQRFCTAWLVPEEQYYSEIQHLVGVYKGKDVSSDELVMRNLQETLDLYDAFSEIFTSTSDEKAGFFRKLRTNLSYQLFILKHRIKYR